MFNKFFGTRGISASVTPRSYRDGRTYLEEMARHTEQLNTQQRQLSEMIESLPEVIGDLIGDSVDERLDTIQNQVNDIDGRLTTTIEDFDTKIIELEDRVNLAVQQIINSQIEVSDPVIYGVISDPNTESHTYLNSL